MQHQINNKSLINSSKLNSVSFNSKKKYQYYLNGALFISKTKHLLNKKSFVSNKTGFYMMPDKRSIDVDTMSDLKKLKEIATNTYKLNITGLSKDRICELIEQRMNYYKKYSVNKDDLDLGDKVKTKKKLFDEQ